MVTEKTHPDLEYQPPLPHDGGGGQSILPADFLSTAFNNSIPPPGYIIGASAPEPQPHHAQTYPEGAEPPTPQKDEHLTVVIGRAKEHKSLVDAYILWFPLGILGFHHFYLRRYEMGLLYVFTLGLGGIGWLVDLFRMPVLVKDANKRIESPRDFQPKTIHDAYVLWFPFGILGFHHYYLGHPAWGLLYTFTLGLAGIGWLIDAFRIPGLVKEANVRLEQEAANPRPRQIKLCDAYALGATPLGILGAHHFYMGRHSFGLFYLFTLGGCGIGWITDWFRMKCLVDRCNNASNHPLGMRRKYIDDAYILAFPLGILGTHHFYLERPGWGVLYFFTLGLAGMGWLVDLIRMPCLVQETNKKLEEEMNVISGIRQVIGSARCSINTRGISVAQPGQPAETASSSAGSDSSFSSLSDPVIPYPPPYAVAMGGYSGYGHVYTVAAPGYGMPAYMPSAPAYAGPPQPPPGQMEAWGATGGAVGGAAAYQGPENVPAKSGQENEGFKGE